MTNKPEPTPSPASGEAKCYHCGRAIGIKGWCPECFRNLQDGTCKPGCEHDLAKSVQPAGEKWDANLKYPENCPCGDYGRPGHPLGRWCDQFAEFAPTQPSATGKECLCVCHKNPQMECRTPAAHDLLMHLMSEREKAEQSAPVPHGAQPSAREWLEKNFPATASDNEGKWNLPAILEQYANFKLKQVWQVRNLSWPQGEWRVDYDKDRDCYLITTELGAKVGEVGWTLVAYALVKLQSMFLISSKGGA